MPTEKQPAAAAGAAGLHYVDDSQPGIRRRRHGRGFSYIAPDGRPVLQPERLRRVRSLAVPPAWSEVWICPDPLGHLQATGRDARGRKQYRYHPRWRETRDEAKFGRLIEFGRVLPRLRSHIARDMALPGMPKLKVIATIVRLLDCSHLRVGNAQYARENGSFGITTLQEDHVRVRGDGVRFRFKGKGGKPLSVDVRDRRVAAVIRRCQDLPGQDLFRYVDDDGEVRTISSGDVNEYLHQTTGKEFTAKDFRTWAGTVLAAQELARLGSSVSERDAKHRLVEAIGSVAAELANTEAVCRKCYVHPAIVDSYLDGSLIAGWTKQDGRGCETVVLALLERRAEAA